MTAAAAPNFLKEGISMLHLDGDDRRGCGLFKISPAGYKRVRWQLASTTTSSSFPMKHSVHAQDSFTTCRLTRAYSREIRYHLCQIKASGQSIGGRQNFSSPISCSTCFKSSENLPMTKEGSKYKRRTRCVKACSQASDSTSEDPSEDPIRNYISRIRKSVRSPTRYPTS
jgi:hypothetical protein